MAITGVSEADYKRFLSHGGDLTFEIGAADIDSSGGFESSPLIKPFLSSGFELKPSPIIAEPQEGALLLLYGGSWTHVVTHVYLNGGSIIYKKLSSGRYEAKVSMPQR
ncbi:MAG: hypothetical protein ACLGHI_08290 [Gammaproteobacteria bacterium]